MDERAVVFWQEPNLSLDFLDDEDEDLGGVELEWREYYPEAVRVYCAEVCGWQSSACFRGCWMYWDRGQGKGCTWQGYVCPRRKYKECPVCQAAVWVVWCVPTDGGS